MPFCAGTCDDPNGFQCEADNNELIDNWDDVKGDLEIPGCMCRSGYIKANREPFSECKPAAECIQEEIKNTSLFCIKIVNIFYFLHNYMLNKLVTIV